MTQEISSRDVAYLLDITPDDAVVLAVRPPLPVSSTAVSGDTTSHPFLPTGGSVMPKSKEQWLEQRESARIAMRGFYGPMKVAKGRYLELRDLWETQWRLFDAAERKLKPVTKVKAQGAAKENPAKRISRRFSKFFDGMDKDNQKKLFDLMKGQTNGASKAEQEDT